MTNGGEATTNETLLRAALETMPSPPGLDDPAGLTEISGRFLRLYVADGDASPPTIRTYHAQAAQYVAWRQQQGVSTSATENIFTAHRKLLVEIGYKPTTIALTLAVIRRLCEEVQWR